MTEQPVPDARPAARGDRGPGSDWLLRYSTLIVLVAMFVGFSLFVDRFLTVFNLTNILQQIAILGIVGAGLTFGFAAKEIDLSVGFTVGLAGILTPLMLVNDYSMGTAFAPAPRR